MREAAFQSWAIGALHLLPIHLHLHPRGPKLDYVGVLVAAILSWAGLPGPGEAALIAASISAAHHHLDLASLIVVAWLGATAGGTAGWIVGLKAGRGIVTGRGPLRRRRQAVVARGERFFARYGVLAVLLTPSWVAGIHGVRLTRFVLINTASALVWALGIAFAAYEIGPPVTDIVSDIGSAAWLIVGVLVLAGGVGVLLRRRRRRGRSGD
jgi:LPXTG-motif cell wall-anchored protein